jgi:hypothetical protein
MKKDVYLFFGLLFFFSFLNCQELKTQLAHNLRIQDCGFESKKGSNPFFLEQKRKSFIYNKPRGILLNLSGLGCLDNSPSAGVGGELGFAYINAIGFTTSGYLGGSSNESIWLGFGTGYTHGLVKTAPYVLIGAGIFYSGIEDEIVGAGTLEFGVNFRLTGWLSAKPSIRLSLGKIDGETALYSNNVLMVSLTIDPFKLLPYYY